MEENKSTKVAFIKRYFNFNPRHRRYALTVAVLILVGLMIYALWPVSKPPVEATDQSITRPAKIKPSLTTEKIYRDMFQEIARKYDFDWRVLEALAYHESSLNYRAVSSTDDMGLMQISPPTWEEWAAKVGVDDPFDPYSNILVGAAYLDFVRKLCTDRGHSEPHCMLVAYTWGPNRLDRFFKNGGTWVEVPAARRRYANRIVEMASTREDNADFFEEVYLNISVVPQ